MAEPTNFDAPALIAIAQLDPSIDTSEKAVEGIVTLIWPYSISSQTFGILLAEPDFRLRRQKGQVRVQFRGSSAKAVARCDIQSGDRVTLNLSGVQWERDETVSGASGRGIEWELRFGEQIALRIHHEDHEPIAVDIDHPAPSPERRIPSPPFTETSSQLQPPSAPHSISAVPPRLQAWSTPAFLKRDRLSTSSYFGSDYDPFDEDEFRDNNRRKKTKFGRASNQWKFTEQTSSPESAAGSRSPVDEPRNGLSQDHENIAESRTVEGDDAAYEVKQTDGRLASHEPLVDAGVQVDDDWMNQAATKKQAEDAAVISPTIQPQSPIPASEDSTLQTSPQETETLEHSRSAEDAKNTEVPIDNPGLPASLGAHNTDRGTDEASGTGTASPPLSNTEWQPNTVSPDQTSIAGRRDVLGLDEAEADDASADRQDLPGVDAGTSVLYPMVNGQCLEESVGERPLRDERSLSRDSHVLHTLQDSGLFNMEQLVEPTLERRSNPPAIAENGREASTSVEETENTQLSISSAWKSSSCIVEQGDRDDHEPSQVVPDTYPSQAETESVVEALHATITSATDEVNRESSEERARITERNASEDISSRSSSPLPGQVVTFSSSPPQENRTLEDVRVQRGFSVESGSEEEEEDAQPQTTPPDMLSDDGQDDEYSEDDVIMNDERRRNIADIETDEEESVSESAAEDYDDNAISDTEAPDDQDQDAQEFENPQTTALPRSSGVEVITIDDSDEDDIDVAQSQNDGAVMSLFPFPGIKCESHPIELLPPIQKNGSPYLGSPPTLPDTIPDSQAAIDVAGAETDVESNMSETEGIR
ncbi:MAG: hypothetical protein Q9224_002179, partial [Gallowayella concinna]